MYLDPNRVAVAKFGGTSVAKYPEKIKDIIATGDAVRTFTIVSAPGKLHADDTKLTDQLFLLAEQAKGVETITDCIVEKLSKTSIPHTKERVQKIVTQHLGTTAPSSTSNYRALVASLGECVAAHLYADMLGATLLDPCDIFVLTPKRGDYTRATLDFTATQARMDAVLPTLTDERYVLPGYYGATSDGGVALFSRGGSDLTGAYMTYFTDADVYENFTDFPVLTASPEFVPNSKPIETITFKELRDLTYSGFTLLHQDVVKPLAEKNIVIEVRSTKDFPERGTIVTDERTIRESIIGVAFAGGFIPVNLYLPGLHEIDFALVDTLTMLRELDIPIEHTSTGIDDMSIVVRKDRLGPTSIADFTEKAQARFGHRVEITSFEEPDLGLLTVVGEGMKRNVGISGQIQKTLADAGVNIYAIGQSITERNIIYCIKETDAKAAIKGIYDTFIV